MDGGAVIKTKRPLRFFLVRHGRSEANAKYNAAQYALAPADIPDLEGVPDESVQLMPVGFQQADDCGAYLRDYLSDNPVEGGLALYCSSYMRARQTAQRIYDNISGITGSAPLRAHESDFLIEQHHGFMDGLTEAERLKLFPDYKKREDMHWINGSKQFAPMFGGEMRVTVAHRVATFLESVFREHADHGVTTFVIVSHGITMRQVAKHLLKLPRELSDAEPNPYNCDVRLLQRHDDGNRVFSDFGYIWHDSHPQEPVLARHPSMNDQFADGAFRNYKPRAPRP